MFFGPEHPGKIKFNKTLLNSGDFECSGYNQLNDYFFGDCIMGALVKITSTDGFMFDAYRAEPEESPRGAILLIQEIFGVNSHIRSVADGYASEGYLVLAPAIFDRHASGI